MEKINGIFTVRDLRKALQEMINVMNLVDDETKELIVVPQDAGKSYLISKIKEAVQYIQEGDVFSSETMEVIKSFGGKIPDENELESSDDENELTSEENLEPPDLRLPEKMQLYDIKNRIEKEVYVVDLRKDKLTRAQAIAVILKKDLHASPDDVIMKADKLFVERGGGASNLKHSKNEYRIIMDALRILMPDIFKNDANND